MTVSSIKSAKVTSEGAPITADAIAAKLSAYRDSLRAVQDRQRQITAEADRLRSQVDAHMGAIQALEELHRLTLPTVESEE